MQEFWVFKPFKSGEDVVNKAFKGMATFHMVALRCDFGVYNPFQSRRDGRFKLLEN